MKQEDWEKEISDFLVGKTIKSARYVTKKEMVYCFGDSSNQVPLVIDFTDGSYIFPMADDEGNDGGALATSDKKLSTIPVMWADNLGE